MICCAESGPRPGTSASLTFSREGPAMLIVERLGHKVAAKWQRRHQSGQGRRTTPRNDAEKAKELSNNCTAAGVTLDSLRSALEVEMVMITTAWIKLRVASGTLV